MNFDNKYQLKKRNIEKIKWIFIIIILIILIIGNYLYNKVSSIIRIFLIIPILLTTVLYIIYKTKKGKCFANFVKATKVEAKKVVWPSYKETFYTTLIIALVTVLTSLLFWALDSILIYFISFITHLRLL